MQEYIVKIWFSEGRIFALLNDGSVHGVPLEMFPPLYYATTEQRENYRLLGGNTSIRWDDVDEDIHISSFHEEETVNYDNEVNRLLSRLPSLDIKAFAGRLGMHWTRLARYRFGVWTPNADTLRKIREGVAALAKEISAACL